MLRAARAEPPDAGIGTFAALSPMADLCGENRYAMTLACTVPRLVTVVIDVHGVDRAGVATGHVAYASKQVPLVPRRALRVDVSFHWRGEATFEFDGIRAPADELWIGPPLAVPYFAVTAELRELDGRCVERALIFQGVGGDPRGTERPVEATRERTATSSGSGGTTA